MPLNFMKILLKLNIASSIVYLLLYIYSITEMINHYENWTFYDCDKENLFGEIVSTYFLFICVAQFLVSLLFIIFGSYNSILIYGNLLISSGLGLWSYLMYESPNHISFDEIYIFWGILGLTNLTISIGALKKIRPKIKLKESDILDDTFSITS